MLMVLLLMSETRGFMHLASGLSVGLAGVAAGYTIGIVGDAVSNRAKCLFLTLMLTFS
jgi:F0F1-type ATP synthase membrane subunit c/vacuolar-type H+-ATPase subunit K